MKFKQILNVKKQALQSAELDLNKAKMRKASVENELEATKEELKNFHKPKNIMEIQLLHDLISFNLSKQEQIKEKLLLCEKEIVHFTHLYKKASLEYEKIKYLHEEELMEQKKEAERKLALELDEIATMRFFAANKENDA